MCGNGQNFTCIEFYLLKDIKRISILFTVAWCWLFSAFIHAFFRLFACVSVCFVFCFENNEMECNKKMKWYNLRFSAKILSFLFTFLVRARIVYVARVYSLIADHVTLPYFFCIAFILDYLQCINCIVCSVLFLNVFNSFALSLFHAYILSNRQIHL